MNILKPMPEKSKARDRERAVPIDRDTELPHEVHTGAKRRSSRVFIGGMPMFNLMHSDVIRIQVYVPQDQAFGLAPGVEAIVRVPELPGVEFRGTVARIASGLVPGTRTLQTEIDVPNPDGALTPGTYCEVELQIPRKTQSLVVPAEAVIFNRNGLNVAAVENGIVHIRKLTVVRDRGTSIEVSDGVKNGGQVILNPPPDLVEGQTVNSHAVAAPDA